MNPAVVVPLGLLAFGAWVLSRGKASAASNGQPALPPSTESNMHGDPSPPINVHSPAPPLTSPLPNAMPSAPLPPSAQPLPPPSVVARSAVQAARDLYDVVSAAIDAGRASTLGTAGKPNRLVADAQRDMGTKPDGIYGPADRARGKELLGLDFPERTAKPKGKSKAKPKPPAASAPAPTATTLRADPVVVRDAAAPATPGRVRLERGASYRATLALEGMDRLASNDQVAAVLQDKVGPWSGLRVTGTGAARTATGTYAGATREVDRPAEVTSFERVQPTRSATPARPQPTAARPPSPPATQASSAPSPALPAVRTPLAAAQALYDYASEAKRKGRVAAMLGTRANPSPVVRDAQRDMGTTPDGIYGPNDRARGKALLGKDFPTRS